ncbi:MAG: hypothetical protein R3F59_23150 [Myxococcota bacterium]
MGGIGTGLTIAAAEPPSGKKRSTPRALHTAMSRSILDIVWKRCGWGAFRGTAGDYLAMERADQRDRDLWQATETEVSWAFMDHAGCCNGSSQACYHWFNRCLAAYRERWDKMAAGRAGLIVPPAVEAAAVLFDTDTPLVGAGGQPYCVPGSGPDSSTGRSGTGRTGTRARRARGWRTSTRRPATRSCTRR